MIGVCRKTGTAANLSRGGGGGNSENGMEEVAGKQAVPARAWTGALLRS